MLTYAGHTVFAAASGREALDLFRRESVDLVITDLGMTGMTGLVLAGELKRIRAIPVVLLTGWADELDPSEVPDVDVVIPKPITRERLLDAIARAVPERVRPG
jgi:CheY-like chemotaxis protein